MPPLDPPPHTHRIVDLLRRQTEARVQLWAWPGAGASEALAAFAQEEGRRAASVDDSPQGFVRRSPEVRWLLWARQEPPPADFLERVAPPGVRFLFWGPERPPAAEGARAAVIPPHELLLSEAEVGAVVERHTAGGHGSELVRRLWLATDGWWRPLALALSAGSRRLEPTAEGLAVVPAVAGFLRQEVVAPLPPEAQELLLELAGGEMLDEGFWRQVWGDGDPRLAALGALLERHGLVVETAASRRLPRLLSAHLRLERGRRWPVARAFASSQRLAAVALSLGRPEQALAALVEATDPLRVGALLALEWPHLLGAAPIALLRAALRLAGAPQRTDEGTDGSSGGGELLSLAVEAAAGDRRRAAAGLSELLTRRRDGDDDRAVTAVARALLAAVRAAGPAPEVAIAALHELAAWGPLPAGLTKLLSTVEVGRAPLDGPEPPAAPTTVAEHLLLWLLRAPAPAVSRPFLAGRRTASGPVVSAALFGVPRVLAGETAEAQEVGWTLRKALRVFTFLASSPDFQASREELMDAVWGAEDEAAVARNFHPTLSHLRRDLTRAAPGLPPPLELHGGVYRLSPAIDWRVDTVEFEAWLRRGRQRQEAGDLPAAVEHWQAGWRLHGGPFLAGEEGGWVSERRERYLQSYVELLRRLGEALLESGELQRAMDAYRSLLIADPLQERVHVAMMRLYGRVGRRDLVRRQYDRLSELLRDELGIEPLAESTAEYHRLMG